jgi:hypothetical protein
MELENRWNSSFINEGKVTLECNMIDQQIKDIKRQMVQADEFIAQKTNVDAFSIAG